MAHTGTATLDQRIERYAVDQQIEVSYDHLRPAAVSVIGDGADPAPIPWLVALVPALVIAAIAVHAGRRLRRTAEVLRANPWVEVPSRLVQVPIAAGAAHALTMIELRGAPDDATVLATAVSFRARPMADLAGTTWVAGDDRRFYLAAPGGAPSCAPSASASTPRQRMPTPCTPRCTRASSPIADVRSPTVRRIAEILTGTVARWASRPTSTHRATTATRPDRPGRPA